MSKCAPFATGSQVTAARGVDPRDRLGKACPLGFCLSFLNNWGKSLKPPFSRNLADSGTAIDALQVPIRRRRTHSLAVPTAEATATPLPVLSFGLFFRFPSTLLPPRDRSGTQPIKQKPSRPPLSPTEHRGRLPADQTQQRAFLRTSAVVCVGRPTVRHGSPFSQ